MVQWLRTLPSDTGDTGSVPGLGRSHMPLALVHVPAATEPVLLSKTSPAAHNSRKPAHG